MQDWSKHYQFLIDCYGFQVFRMVYYPNSFGDQLVDLNGPLFRSRFAVDRSVPEISIAFLEEPNEWTPLSYWHLLIHGKEPEWTDSLTVTFETISATLREDLPEIEKLFEPSMRELSKLSITKIAHEKFLRAFKKKES